MTRDMPDDVLEHRAEEWPLLSQPIEVALAPVVADLEVDDRTREAPERAHDAAWSVLYEQIRPLGRGGMGRTILARERLSDRVVCIKELFPHANVRMLEQEYHALSRMSHPNIVRVLRLAPNGAPPYLVAEYVEGVDIRAHVRGHPEAHEALLARVMGPVFDAIATLHSRDIIHRDLKPENILVSSQTGQPIVIDLGLAVVDRMDHEGHVTAEGLTIYGTPAYMAPEQMTGEKLKPACDVYALGVVMYELVTGHCPFPGSDFGAVFQKKFTATAGLELPERGWMRHWPVIGKLIRDCTSPNRHDRPSAADARERLSAVMSSSGKSTPWWRRLLK